MSLSPQHQDRRGEEEEMSRQVKYKNMVFIDTRDNLKWSIYSYFLGGKQTKYWVKIQRPKGRKILKRFCVPESTITRLKPYLREIL